MKTIQIKTTETWKEIAFSELKKGDVFRNLIDDKVIVDNRGHSEYMASSSPYYNGGELRIRVYNG